MTSQRLSDRPLPFRLHIDHLDNDGGQVWAVRVGRKYRVVHDVVLGVPTRTVFRPGRRQPRAWIAGVGIVVVSVSREARAVAFIRRAA